MRHTKPSGRTLAVSHPRPHRRQEPPGLKESESVASPAARRNPWVGIAPEHAIGPRMPSRPKRHQEQ
jgi:hypothetical protein